MWKTIPNFEGRYEINENGDVRSIARTVVGETGRKGTSHGCILKPNRTKNGYLIVHLSKEGKRTAVYVHRLVAILFVPNPDSLPTVNHKNGNKEDCRASNLEWTTYAENNQHAYDTGLHPKGEQQYRAKLTEDEVREIRRIGKNGTFQSIANRYGVNKATIHDVLCYRTWKTVT